MCRDPSVAEMRDATDLSKSHALAAVLHSDRIGWAQLASPATP